jgi:formate hydrogenlyase transcriptional activator
VITATNRDLERSVNEGRFRSDLYYRLNVFPIHLPPLRDRREDIPLLVRYLAQRYGTRSGKRIPAVSQETLHVLQEYPWPGNVRELENVVERAMILSKGEGLDLAGALTTSRGGGREPGIRTLDDIQREYILTVLERTGWRVSGDQGAADLLGLKPTTLEARMKKLGITRTD